MRTLGFVSKNPKPAKSEWVVKNKKFEELIDFGDECVEFYSGDFVSEKHPYSDNKGKSLCCGSHITKKGTCQKCQEVLPIKEANK